MKMKIFSDLAGYNRNMCQHVYTYTGPGLCRYCGLDTHDPGWDVINKGYSNYREKVGFFFNNNTWWSIQPEYDRINICTYQDQKFAKIVERKHSLCCLALVAPKQFGQQKKTLELSTIVLHANETTNTNLYHHNWFGSAMAILDNLEASMADDDGMPSKTVNDVIKEILEDPEHYKLMERLKYMEDHGI